MKFLVRFIIISIPFLFLYSCNNDFLEEGNKEFIGKDTHLILYPDRNQDAKDYSIYCQRAGNSKYKISHAPLWLQIDSRSGQFVNNSTTINCKINTEEIVSETGIYHSYMVLSVEGKGDILVHLSYIIEGNPKIEIASHYIININNLPYDRIDDFTFRNIGDGILILKVLESPEWLAPYYDRELGHNANARINLGYFSPNRVSHLYLLYPWWHYEYLLGKIIFETNDKENPIVEVEVEMVW
jgi:hypothetical protein